MSDSTRAPASPVHRRLARGRAVRLLPAGVLLLASAAPAAAEGPPAPASTPPQTGGAATAVPTTQGPAVTADAASEPPPWEEGEPVPPGYHVDTGPMVGMAATGGVTLGVTWIASGVIGYLIRDMNSSVGGGGKMFDSYGTWPMWLPVVGPLVTIATTADGKVPVFLIVPAAIGQWTGFILLVAGLTTTESELVADKPARASVYVTPQVTADTVGLAAVGTF